MLDVELGKPKKAFFNLPSNFSITVLWLDIRL
jgi:hypothetical protein